MITDVPVMSMNQDTIDWIGDFTTHLRDMGQSDNADKLDGFLATSTKVIERMNEMTLYSIMFNNCHKAAHDIISQIGIEQADSELSEHLQELFVIYADAQQALANMSVAMTEE
jgi:hypothetical protein